MQSPCVARTMIDRTLKIVFFYRKIVLLGDIKSKPINPAGVTYGGLRGAYQAYWPGIKDRYYV